MNTMPRDNAIRARIKQAMGGHVTLVAYYIYSATRPIIERARGECAINIIGPMRPPQASALILRAYERK